jgi:hypothetical protein
VCLYIYIIEALYRDTNEYMARRFSTSSVLCLKLLVC